MARKKAAATKSGARKKVATVQAATPTPTFVVSTDHAHDACVNAALILDSTRESCEALLKAFDLARAERGKPRGMTTDEEQDLLRSMLVMAAAGLDAMSKQIVRDALPGLIECDERALDSFEKFLSRQLRPDPDAPDDVGGAKLLARLLTRQNPQAVAIEAYVQHLTKGSLQSSTSLFDVVASLGLWPDEVGVDRAKLDPIFGVRNKIIHELDMNLLAERRTRNVRGKKAMVSQVEILLAVAEMILRGVDAKLASA